jgi:hypothetical protein
MDVIKVEPDSDCATLITSVCSAVKEEEHLVPMSRHEDEVSFHVCFTVWKFDSNFIFIYPLCNLSFICQTATTRIQLETMGCS